MKQKRILRRYAIACCLALLVAMTAFGAAAQASEGVDTATRKPFSPALSVLAAQQDMAVATLCGNDYYFSEDVFARTLNLSKVSAITVVSLPEVTAGELLMGSERVSAGQRIPGEDLKLLSFAAADSEVIGAAFTFSPEGGAYEMTCHIHVLEEVNYSPTVTPAQSGARSVSTHKNLVGYGQLYAYDPEGDAMVFEIVRAPKKGIVVMSDAATGEYVYLPRTDYVGDDSFLYVARDVYGNYSTAAEVSVSVEAPATQIVYRDMIGRREYNAVLSVTEAGIMEGEQTADTWNFRPDDSVTRGEFLVMAMEAMGVGSLPSVNDTGFSDNDVMDQTLRSYVAAAKELGYIEGMPDGEGNLCFKPGNTLTRAEAAVMLARMIGQGDVEVAVMPTFADGSDIPAWASDAIATLSAKGILSHSGGSIAPNATVSRADAACMLAALIRQQ